MNDKPKTWDDFTNEELVVALGNTFDWELSKKIMAVLKRRKVSLSDMYYGRYDRNAKGGDNESKIC